MDRRIFTGIILFLIELTSSPVFAIDHHKSKFENCESEMDVWVIQKYVIPQISYEFSLARPENSLDVIMEHLEAAEHHFQNKKWEISYQYYCSVQNLISLFNPGVDESTIFRIRIGKELCESFIMNERDTIKERLNNIFDSIQKFTSLQEKD